MDCVATVIESTFITPTIKSVRLRLDQDAFSFLPGQSLWPKFERDGKQFSKIYSIASSPSHCPEVELCVSRVGWSSAFLQDLSVGQTIAARGPYGLLTLKEWPTRPRLYLAEGSGIAPIKSQIDWLYETEFPHPVCLIQSNPETRDRLPYLDHWQTLAERWPQFHYRMAIAQSPEMVLSQQGLDLSEFEIDVCAVNQRPVQLQNAAIALGAIPNQIRFESFHSF